MVRVPILPGVVWEPCGVPCAPTSGVKIVRRGEERWKEEERRGGRGEERRKRRGDEEKEKEEKERRSTGIELSLSCSRFDCSASVCAFARASKHAREGARAFTRELCASARARSRERKRATGEWARARGGDRLGLLHGGPLGQLYDGRRQPVQGRPVPQLRRHDRLRNLQGDVIPTRMRIEGRDAVIRTAPEASPSPEPTCTRTAGLGRERGA